MSASSSSSADAISSPDPLPGDVVEPAMEELTRNEKGFFPVAYFVNFLEWINERRDQIEILTYDSLPWGDDYDHEHHHPAEFECWRHQLHTGERDPSRIYLLLQHDVDDRPERTQLLMQEEDRLNVPTNVMIFNRRLNRLHLQRTGEVVYRDYEIDDDLLQRLESRGFVIGYHSNAYEQANFDRDLAREIFIRDVRELRERFTIRYFCPHGGVRDAEGHSNASLDLPGELSRDIRWVLNRYSVRFDGVYSDGAINSPRRNAVERDMRNFISTWKPGGRYRILTHPQYYHTTIRENNRLHGVEWYDEILACYDDGDAPHLGAWRDVRLPSETSTTVSVPTTLSKNTQESGRCPTTQPGRPIFIGGDGRSGTTLLNVILDSHPSLSVGPELHFAGRKLPNLGPYVLECIELLDANDPRTKGKALSDNPDIKPGVQFVHRVERAGVDRKFIRATIEHIMHERTHDIETFEERCELVHEFGEHTRTRDRTERFGYKIMREIRNISRYASVWPGAQFIHIIRDGRDVAASQMLEHGSWGYGDIEKAAEGWVALIRDTRANATGLSYHEVRYEDIVFEAKSTLKRVLAFLDQPWHRAVLKHHRVHHDFFKTKVRHPSRDQTKKPINASSVGRYKRDLDPDQIAAFEHVARGMLEELGYEVAPKVGS